MIRSAAEAESRSGFRFGRVLFRLLDFENLAAPVIAVGGDMVAAVPCARGRILRHRGALQRMVRTAHVALGAAFFAFLDGHPDFLKKCGDAMGIVGRRIVTDMSGTPIITM